MSEGTVKWFNTQKGYGFINPDDESSDVFVHITAVQNSGLNGLNEGQRVSYDLAEQRNGRVAAVDISLIEACSAATTASSFAMSPTRAHGWIRAAYSASARI